ncbi:MAG: ATP synthase F1 subunit delta [Gammaproteobacteria bacterium TMED112]|nr:MAG: ATP synthase F1 subunit delta [Gammaproteobacteria bacterium TMED112]|tara:strand:+ start:43391 stop:43909 length:519 start_codon:yes stop_codon:yes gene_type:complete
MNKLLEVYSKGLYDSLRNESITSVVEHFQHISNDASVGELTDLFKNKTVQKEEKLKAAIALVDGDSDLEAFMKTLGNNGRLDLLPAIFSFFVDYASRRQNNVPVKVTVNEEPNEEIKNKVSLFVTQKMGHKTPIKYEINKAMLGGVVLKYKDNEIDLSVDNKLDGLNSVLTN